MARRSDRFTTIARGTIAREETGGAQTKAVTKTKGSTDMPVRIPRSLVEFILFGPADDRRQLQDSPILGDVWVEYARNPAERLQLLITPYKENAAAAVARELRNGLQRSMAASQKAKKGKR